MVANIRAGATVGGAIRYNEEKVNRGQAYAIHPLDAMLELANVQAYEEEQQQQIRKRKKRSMNRR